MRVKGKLIRSFCGDSITVYSNSEAEIEIPEEEILKPAEEIKKEKRFRWCFDCEYSNFDCNAKNCFDKNSTARIKKNFKPKEQTNEFLKLKDKLNSYNIEVTLDKLLGILEKFKEQK